MEAYIPPNVVKLFEFSYHCGKNQVMLIILW
jgi:hypothetical protein